MIRYATLILKLLNGEWVYQENAEIQGDQRRRLQQRSPDRLCVALAALAHKAVNFPGRAFSSVLGGYGDIKRFYYGKYDKDGDLGKMDIADVKIAYGLESAVVGTSVHNKEITLPISTEYGDIGDIDDPAYWPQDEYRTEQFREYRDETKAVIALYRESDAKDGMNFMEAFSECQSRSRLWRFDETGLLKRVGTSCRLPFCPVDNRKRANTIRHRLKRVLLPYLKEGRLRSVVLTLKHTGLTEDIDRMQKSWGKLCRKRGWQELNDGAVWFLQCEPVDGGREWHIHRHILVIGDYIPQKRLSEMWREVTGDSFVVHIQAIQTERGLDLALEDVTRYVSRPANILKIAPEHRLDLFRALKKRRLCGKTGDGGKVSFATTDPNEPKCSGHFVGDFEKIIRLAARGNDVAGVLLYCFRQGEPSPPDLSCEGYDYENNCVDYLSLVEPTPPCLWTQNERAPPGSGVSQCEGDVPVENDLR